jgi:hypothetical protein
LNPYGSNVKSKEAMVGFIASDVALACMGVRLGFYIGDYGWANFAKMWLIPHLIMNNWVVMLTLVSSIINLFN